MQKIIKLIALVFLLAACSDSPTATPTVVPLTATPTATALPPMPLDERLQAFMEKMPIQTPMPREALPAEGVVEFQVLHWNDFHGELGEHVIDGTWVPGAARLAAFVKAEEAKVEPDQVLLLDAGDWYEGADVSRPSRGAKALEFYKKLGVDAITLGNHEFFYGMPRFYQLISQASPIDILSANFRRQGLNNICSDQRILNPYQIYEMGKAQGPKVRVAVIGVSIRNLDALVYNEIWTTGICFQTPAGEIIKIYDQLMETEHPDVLVVLSHSGLEEDLKIARDLNTAGKPVDIIIGGHSHSWIEAPEIVGNTYVVTAGELGRAVGEFDLRYDRVSKLLDVKWRQEIFTACSPEDPDTLVFLEDTVSASLPKQQCAANIPPPDKSMEYLNGVRLTYIESFDGPSVSGWWSETAKIKDGVYEILGKNWNGIFRDKLFNEGSGVIVDFTYTQGSVFNMFLESGDWDTDPYKRFGVQVEAGTKMDMMAGKKWFGGTNLAGNFIPRPNTTYSLMLALLPEGEFLSVIWDPTNPSKTIYHHEKIGETWSKLDWHFNIGANSGTITFDNYREIKFDGMK